MNFTLKIVIGLICLAVATKSNCQEYKNLFNWEEENITSIQFESALDSVLDRTNDLGKLEETALLAHDFSVKFYRAGLFNKALKYGLNEVEAYEKLSNQSPIYAKALFQVGVFFERIKAFDESISYHQKVINLNVDNVLSARSYCRLGSCYEELGDYFKAITYYKEGISKLNDLKQYRLLVRHYINFAIIYEKIDTKSSLESLLEILTKIEKLNEIVPLSENNFTILHHRFANYYNTTEKYNFEKAKHHYNILLNRAIANKDSSRINSAYVNLGNLYIKESQDSALWFLQESLTYPASRISRAKTYRNLCVFQLQKDQLNKALLNIHKALVFNLSLDADFRSIPTKKQLVSAVDKEEVLSSLIIKAKILISKYKIEKDLNLIHTSLANLQAADTLVNIIQDLSTEEDSKLIWSRKASEIYTKAIYCAILLEEDELVFTFSEKTKGLLLTESILANAESKALPYAIEQKEIQLRNEILALENKLLNENDTVELVKLKNWLISEKIQQQEFSDSVRLAFPALDKTKLKTQLFSLKSIQEQLDSESMVVSYVWDTDEENFDNVFGISITNKNLEIFTINGIDSLNNEINRFKKLLASPFNTKDDQKVFNNVANQLYNKLFPTKKMREGMDNKHVLIIPDHSLQNIPFEALITNPKTNKYLIESCEISYAYSMSFLLHNKNLKRNPNNQFIGFSPNNFKHSNLTPLKKTETEVNTIASIVDGEFISGDSASKNSFFQKSSDHAIIHLATHANAAQDPWIAFGDSKMSLRELYNSKNKADLIVLSACNTSVGDIAEGEGVFSLARGFFYAGANSVVATIWNIDDKASSQIMIDFYQHIKDGKTKSKALHLAKKTFLTSHSLSDASPYYWASFTLTGDPGIAPIHSSDYLVEILLTFLGITGLGFLIFLKRNK